MSQKKDEELFLNGKFKDSLKLVLKCLYNKELLSKEEYENDEIFVAIQECQTFIVASAVIKLELRSDITFVYNDQNSFILSNIEEGKPFIPFSKENVSRIIECLF
jgi:hypothetical protein